MIAGRTFDNQKVSAAAHGAIFRSALSDGVLSGCALAYAGMNLTIGKGYFISCGREVEIQAAETVTVTQTSGYARIKAVINTAASSTAEVFEQFSWGIDYAASMSGFASLTQEDINGDGVTYEMELCIVSLGSGGISGIARQPVKSHGRATEATATLTAAGWTSKTQTVSVAGVTASNLVFASPQADSWTGARDNGVRCTGQGAGTLTFTCEDVPTTALSYNVAIFN